MYRQFDEYDIRFGFVLASIAKTGQAFMKSLVVKRSIIISGHKTSISLEEPFWKALKDIASRRRQTLSELVGGLDAERKFSNLSSAVRLFVLNHYQERLTSERAGPSDDSPVRVSH